jgi:gliding-associated putative ABC transporter substrate-binding component GldG
MEVGSSKASRRLKYSTNYIALAFIVLGILAVVNFFFTRHFARIDLTQDKRYTLTTSTKEVLGNLDDIVTIKFYFSSKIPSYLVNLKRDVTDLLDEYRAYAGGNITVKLIDPTENPALQQELRFMGIPQVQLNIIEKDQAQLTNVYLGMAIFYADKKEIIPFISDTRNLEYELTSAVVKVTRTETKTVGIFTGKDHSLSGDYQAVKQLLEKQYTVQEVTLSAGDQTLDQIHTLIVAGSREPTDEQLYAIDQFLMRGGKIVFLVDTVDIKEGLQAASFKPGTEELLQHYGVKVEENLVLDRANANAAFRSGFMTFRIPYPFWVKIIQEGFSPDNPAVSNLESLVLPWTSSLTVLEEKTSALTVTELARSTPLSWIRKGFYSLDPQQRFLTPDITTDSYPLVLSLSGTFTSFFADKPIPDFKEADTAGKTPPPRETIKTSSETQLIVVGNSRFITNDIITQFQDNQVFLLNITDWLTLGEQLIGIRSRGATDRPIKETTEYTKTFIKFLNMFAVPLLLILFGLVRFYLRRRKKRKDALAW